MPNTCKFTNMKNNTIFQYFFILKYRKHHKVDTCRYIHSQKKIKEYLHYENPKAHHFDNNKN
jgi:hypothetical protein